MKYNKRCENDFTVCTARRPWAVVGGYMLLCLACAAGFANIELVQPRALK
jgi:hypothetical protein